MAGSNYYVYQYLLENGIPYYIGKGKNNRIDVDHKHIALPPVERRIIVKDNLTNEEAKILEGELIVKYGRKIDGGILDNIKINQWACFDGWKHKLETIKKISKGNTGKVRTEEAKEKYRQPKTLEHAQNIRKANLGKTLTDETKQKIRETVLNRYKDPEYKSKISAGLKGKPWSEARRNAWLQNKGQA
jgi:NUMOD3 motif